MCELERPTITNRRMKKQLKIILEMILIILAGAAAVGIMMWCISTKAGFYSALTVLGIGGLIGLYLNVSKKYD